MNQDGLPRHEMSMVEQRLPCGQPGDRHGRSDPMVDGCRQRRKVTGLYRNVFRKRAVAGPVGQPEDSLADRKAGGAVTELGDDS